MFVCGVHAPVRICGGQNLWELVLSFHRLGSQDQTQVIKLCSKCLYLSSHLARPLVFESESYYSPDS